LIVGIILGAALVTAAVVWLMRTRMVVAHRSGRSFEETCAALETTVLATKGWGFPITTWNFYQTFLEKNLVPDGFTKIKVFFVCNAGLARQVLSSNPAMAGIMPCSWAVYEQEDGSVWISKMNITLMARLFSGVVGTTMGKVAEADEVFLGKVLG
jgi:uncharacterized protein (DUF302 family)